MTTDLNIDLFNNLRLELRRGLLIVAVLAQLRHEHYGYSLRTDLAALGMEIDEGTLYPLLRRLESQGLLESEWREENNRQKRFYKLSRDGRQILKLLLTELEKINASLTRII
jgi:PadR family transcriptional regulator